MFPESCVPDIADLDIKIRASGCGRVSSSPSSPPYRIRTEAGEIHTPRGKAVEKSPTIPAQSLMRICNGVQARDVDATMAQWHMPG
jgi:hypothetical protein